MIAIFFLALASLISVVNPLGAIPVFLALTPSYTHSERIKTAFHTSIYFFLILTSFFFAGTYILSFFGISINGIRIAGGLIILNSGYALLNGKFSQSRAINHKVKQEALQKEDISFTPLAMPLLSGPGSISLLITMYEDYGSWSERFMITGVILATAMIIYLILRTSPLLFRVLGFGGLKAISRIMGFLVMAIGVEFIISGIIQLVKGAI